MTLSRAPRLVIACVLAAAGCGSADARTEDERAGARVPDAVHITWLSVTNWIVEAGDTRILLDGYVSRLDRATVSADGTSTTASPPDRGFVEHVRDAILPDHRLDQILIGHAHWDHAFDTPAWAKATGARIAGGRTVCLQAQALGVPADRCTAVEGGEVIEIGPYVRARAVRWHHSGDTTATGRTLRAPLELRDMPRVDPATGGLRPGFVEDYPNGGGARAWLIVVRTTRGPVTLFWSNTANSLTWDAVLPASDTTFMREHGVDMTNLVWAGSTTPVRDHLRDAMAAEQLQAVDLWIGYPNARHVEQVDEVLRPRAFMPQHWDDFWTPLADGVTRPFSAASVEATLSPRNIRLIAPRQYFDRFRIEPSGIRPEGDAGVRARLGIPEAPPRR